MFKKLLATFAGALLALSIGAAGAYFTAQVQVPDSVIKAGTVHVSAEPTSAALSIDALAPGTVTTRPLTVKNSGNLSTDVVLTASKKAGITDLYNALTCRVTCGGVELANGPLSAMKTTPLRLAPGAEGDFRFEIGLPADTSNALAGEYTRVSVYIDAEQAH